MTNTASYKKWLIKNNISRPHLSGRWRLRYCDITVFAVPAMGLGVGKFFSANPTIKESDFSLKWRDSVERGHKASLVGILRFAFSKRHLIEDGRIKARKITLLVRQALVSFANGDEAAGITALHTASLLDTQIHSILKEQVSNKSRGKQKRREEGLKKAQPLGVEANKRKAKENRDNLYNAVKDYIDNYPNALALKNEGLLKFLKDRELTSGYADETIKKYARPIFRVKLQAVKMEKR